MNTSVFAIISLDTLNRLFEGKSEGEVLIFPGSRCVGCGKSVDVTIQKTSGGYGFLNGILSEPSQGEFMAMCDNCKERSG